MRIERLTFDGTAEEFQQVAHIFANRGDGSSAERADGARHEGASEATLTFVRRLLTRRRIANGQLAMFRALYQAGDQGLSRAGLAAATSRTEKQIDGVMGALGRRINHTSGIGQVHPEGGTAALLDWRTVDGEMRYVMRPELRKTLEDLKIVSPPSPA